MFKEKVNNESSRVEMSAMIGDDGQIIQSDRASVLIKGLNLLDCNILEKGRVGNGQKEGDINMELIEV